MGKSYRISLSICVLIVLSVLWNPAYSDDNCSIGCRGSSGNPGFLTGHKYTYSLEGEVTVYLTGAENQETGVKLSAQATVSALGNCAHVLRVQNVVITGPGGKKYGKPPGIDKPVRFVLEDGALAAQICAEEGDTRRSLNIKRAIISLLQNEHKQASEVDIFGVCPTESSASQEGGARLVHRSRDLARCAHREHGGQGLVSAVYNPTAEIKGTQVLRSTLNVESKVTNGVPEKVAATEEYLYKPFSVGQNGARAKVITKLNLVGNTGGSDNGRFTEVRSIIFENPHGVKSEQSNLQSALRAVKDTAKVLSDQASYKSAGAFVQLIRILRVANKDDLLSVFNQVKANSLEKRVFLDGLLRAGTGYSIEATVQLIKSRELSTLEKALVFLSLGNAKHVTNEAIKAATTLLDLENTPKELYLGVGALAGAYCREHRCHGATSQSDGVAALSQKLASRLNCKPSSKVEEDNVVAILKGIRNIRHIEDSLVGKLVECVTDNSVKARVKVAALEAYQADPCSDQLKDTAIQTMKNRNLDSEIRIKAYLTVIECPCGKCANEIKDLLNDEPSIQVVRFIASSLRHIRASANPDKQLAREQFSQIRIPTKYSIDDRKYSFYREFSYNVDALGTGGVFEQAVIYSQDSFLPRSASLNLTAEVFGHNLNVFEIGGRQGNLDRVMEHFLGPKGYFHTHTPSEIYDDITHRSEEAKRKFQGKLRGRRALKQDIDNFDRQIKDDAEPYNNELDLDIYVKLFGTDTIFLSMGDGNGFDYNSVLDAALKGLESGANQLKNFHQELRAHLLFLDAELAYPTFAGLPLKLNLVGASTGRLEVSTKIDIEQIFRDPNNAKIDIKLIPSSDVEISGQLLVDADQVATGLKVSANLHSATGGHLIVQVLENGQGFDLQYVLPVKKQEIVTASNDLVYVTIEKGQQESSVALRVDTDRKEYSGCFDQLSAVIGLTLCGEVSVPFSVSGPEAQTSIQKYLARFPLTGPSMVKVHLEENDLRGYHVKGLLHQSEGKKSFELLFEAEGSKNRKTALTGEFVNVPEERTIKLGLESPINNWQGQVSLYNNPSQVAGLVLVKIDAQKYYGRVGFAVQGNDQRRSYKPFIEFELPDGQGTKTLNVDGQVIRESTRSAVKYTLDGIKINLSQEETVQVKGYATFEPNGFESEVEAVKRDHNMALKVSAKGHDASIRFTNTLNSNINFDLKLHSENQDKHYQNDLELCYGPDLNSQDQKVAVKQLLKYQETEPGKYNVLTRNELSVTPGMYAKVYAEVDSKKVDIEVEGKVGANKAEFDLEARTHIKAPGDYSVKIEAEVNDKGIEAFSKRDIVSADKSNFENYFVVKNVLKYELSGVVMHKNKPDDVNIGAVGHLKVSGGGKTEELKFDVGVQDNANYYSSHAKLSKANDYLIDYLLKFNRGANPTGQLKFVLKGTISCNGQYKVSDSDGTGNGLVIVDFVQSGRKIKGDVKFKVKAPVYSADVDVYLNFEKDNNDKIHFSTNTKRSDSAVDSKNKLDYNGQATELNVYVEGNPSVDLGKSKSHVQVILPNERVLEFEFKRELSKGQNNVVNGNAELVLSDSPRRGANPSKFVYKGKIANTNLETDTINYDGQISITLKDGRNLENSFSVKNNPQGENKFKFDFKSDVNGNLIPKPASLMASMEYTNPDKILQNENSKYRLKGNYGGEYNFEIDGNEELQFESGDKKYFDQYNVKLNLPFEKAHDIKLSSSQLYLIPKNKDVLIEYTVSESVQIDADVYKVDASGKIARSEGFGKIKVLVPHVEPFALDTSYKGDFEGDQKFGEVAVKATYGKGKSATINIDATKTPNHEYTLHIKGNAPQAEQLKKLDITLHTKRPAPDSYNSNLVVDADGKVYKVDYVIVYSKANPALDIKLSCPEMQKTCRVYMKGSNLSSNQGKVELKLENIKDLSLDMTSEGVIQKENIALKVNANSEKLGLKNYYSEITSKDTPSGKRLEFQARNNNVNLLSGSTSFISKQEGSKTIIEGSGTVKVKEEEKSATFKYIRDILTEGQEQGIETFMNIAIGERSYVTESRVTNLEYKYSYVYCEEKKQCAHAELNSKVNVQTPGVLQHNVNIVLDLRKLGFAPEFGLQMLNEVSEQRLPQYTLDVHLNKEDKKYHLHVYSTPKQNQLPAGITITLPQREIALESMVTYRGDKQLPFPIRGDISLYLDKNKPQQKAAIRGLIDVTGNSNEHSAVAELGFSHPKLGREAVLKYNGLLQHTSENNFKIESTSTFSHPHFGNDRTSKFLFEVTPRTFKLIMDTPLVKVVDMDAHANVNENLQEGQLVFSLLQGKAVRVYAVAKEYKYYEFTTGYSEDTQRKLSVVARIDPEKRVDVTADIVLPGEKKNIAHGALFIQDNLVRSDYGASKENFEYFTNALKKDLDNLEGRIAQLGTKAGEEYSKTVEKAQQIAKQLGESYRTELEQMKQELVDDETLQEVDKVFKAIAKYVGSILTDIIDVTEKIVTTINNAVHETAQKIKDLYDRELAPQLKQLYENCAAVFKEYAEGLLDLVAHFAALIADFFEKHKAELQELTNTFTEIFKDITRLFVSRIREVRQAFGEAFANAVQQIKDMPIIATIKEKLEEFAVPEQILTALNDLHETVKVILPTEETRQFADAVYAYVQKKLKQESTDDNAELRIIYEKFAVALTSIIQHVRQQLNDMGVPSLFTFNFAQLGGGLIGDGESFPTFGGSSSLSLLNQALTGDIPSPLELIRAYRPRYVNPLDEMPNKLRALVVNGQHIFTFDGRHLTFPGTCRYVLAHDYVDRNFTLVIQLQNGLPKALALEDKSGNIVELKENGQVALNGATHGFPVMEKDTFAFRETNGRVGLGTKYGVMARCTSKLTVCYIEVSGYYFSKLRGLLGDGNNEPYTDFKLPSGKITTSEAEFGNSYRLAGSCPQVQTPDHSHHHGSPLPAECEQVFSGSSPLRPLSLLLDVHPFLQACIHACTANPNDALREACDLGRGYAALAVTGLLPAVVPPACVQCTDADKPRKLGEQYSIEIPTKQADIIVLVETTVPTESYFKNIAVPVVQQVIDSLKSKRVTDVRVYLVGITPKFPYPIVYDTDIRLKTCKVKFDDPSRYSHNLGPQRVRRSTPAEGCKVYQQFVDILSYFGIDNVIAGYTSVLEIPLRAGAVKTTISVVGETCRKRFFLVEATRALTLIPDFKAEDHTQNIIAPVRDLHFNGKESSVIAYDGNSVLVFGDKNRGKDTQELRRSLFNPPDACTDFIELNNGLVISANNFQQNSGQQKEFVQTVGVAIADRMLAQRRTQSCVCAYADPFSARSVCVPTSIKDAPKGKQRRRK